MPAEALALGAPEGSALADPEAGILAAYSMYVNQNPAGAPWSSMLVLEYRDQSGLAQREIVKDKVRKRLSASDPVWKAWSTDKGAVRKEKGVALADAIVPAPMTK